MLRNHLRVPFMLVMAFSVTATLLSPAVAQTVPEEPPPLIGKTLAVGAESFEPTLGVDGNDNIFFSVTRSPGLAVGWRPGMYMSADHGATWKDISPTFQGTTIPPDTNDPYIYVDQSTGRIFNFHMTPILTCSGLMSFSDDQGSTWTTTPLGCGGEFPYDHQTMVAAKPRVFPTNGYPNVLIQCVNSIYAEMCSRSLDGGLTWTPANPAYVNDHAAELCGTQTGHLVAALDGTVYLPTPVCGTVPSVYVTEDDGLTWTKHVISDIPIPFVDPTIAVGEDGTLYAAFIDQQGSLYYTTSRDKAVTWTPARKIAEGLTTHLPAIAVGDAGKVAIAFPGTDDLPDGFDTAGYPSDAEFTRMVEWYPYLAITYNGLDETPTFEAVNASPGDPIARGAECTTSNRCTYQIDFIDATIGPDGLPYAAFSDGCTGFCSSTPGRDNDGGTGDGTVATLASGTPLCESGCAWKFHPPGGP